MKFLAFVLAAVMVPFAGFAEGNTQLLWPDSGMPDAQDGVAAPQLEWSAAAEKGYSADKIGEANGLSPEGAFDKVVEWYDGYKFHASAEKVVNPVSFDLCVPNREVENSFLTQLAPVYAGLDPDRSINNQFAAAEALVAGDAAKGDHSLDGCPPREHAPLILQAGGDRRDADAGA